ncbi:MAG: DUF2971 domain-containing protein [Lacibacter sp.]
MSTTPSRLYHYCSIESLYHIVKSRSIWLSNSRQMNDSDENIWIEKYFPIIYDYFKEAKYAKLLSDSIDIYKWNSNPPFIFCLSANKDLLSQWRAYSEDGHGVSIGFNIKSINIKSEIPSPNVYARNTLGIAKVEYYTYLQKNKIIELCKKIKEKFDNEKDKDERIIMCLELGSFLVNCALVFKNSNFREEREWRIIHTPTSHYEVPLSQLSSIQFRLKQNRIVTHFVYSFENDFKSNLISEIVLGPKCQMSVTEIEQFLKYHNLKKTKITISKSTYR